MVTGHWELEAEKMVHGCCNFAKLSFINKQWDLNFDIKNQFLDPKLVGFGSLNVKIGLELWKLWKKL